MSEDIRNQVAAQNQIIKAANTEIERLQLLCGHTNHTREAVNNPSYEFPHPPVIAHYIYTCKDCGVEWIKGN